MAKRTLARIFAAVLPIFYCWHSSLDAPSATVSSRILRAVRSGAGHNSTIVSDDVRIAFQLHDPPSAPVEIIDGDIRGICKNAPDLPQSLRGTSDGGRILDVIATIQTNLHILHVGDSVMRQLWNAFNIMCGGSGLSSDKRRQSVFTARVDGGGSSAFWAMTGLPSSQGYLVPTAYKPGGGWNMDQVHELKNETKRENRGRGIVYDAVVLRVMHGWMKIENITYARLEEAVDLSHKLFGAKTVVFMTIPWTNNVKTPEIWEKCQRANEWMRQIALAWNANATQQQQEEGDKKGAGMGVKHVLVMEYAQYYHHVIWRNARHLRYDVTDPLQLTKQGFADEQDFLLERIALKDGRVGKDGKDWSPTVAMVCHDVPRNASLGHMECTHNRLFKDGMHICPESLASRFGAGLACLLGCVHNGQDEESDEGGTRSNGNVRSCERECNSQFMSVRPIDAKWLKSGPVASFVPEQNLDKLR